ncbi:MAG: DUF1844 domain-containing protein [Fimbriimonadales bacterium]|nr:DUF1844 domain-containing protein [Fimbriimonadales bacterium]
MGEQEKLNPANEQEAVQGADVPTLLQYTLHLYIAAAWQMMGLVPDPLTHQIRTDLQQAKIAIDCADFLAGQLRPFVEESIMRELQRQIRDLKVNFVARISEPSHEPGKSDPSVSMEA